MVSWHHTGQLCARFQVRTGLRTVSDVMWSRRCRSPCACAWAWRVSGWRRVLLYSQAPQLVSKRAAIFISASQAQELLLRASIGENRRAGDASHYCDK